MTSLATGPKERGALYSFGEASFAGGRARFTFECSRYGSFTETVDFGAEGTVPPHLLGLLHVALGVSSYKAAAASHIVFPPLTPAGRAMAEALFTEGLAEFFVRSGLPYPPRTRFSGEILEPEGGSRRGCEGTPLVAFGGGKDSYVAGRIVEQATGSPAQYASVVLSPAVRDVLTATAPVRPLFIERRLDPALPSLEGAYSGHVPITAINILVLTIAGLLRGSGPILFANERSADEPTMMADGIAANHQYSKSSAFEALVREAVGEAAPAAPPSYSVLRPFSELWIAQRFSAIPEAFGRFTSCNRNFRLAGDAERRWCGACAKCAFTSLILSPFIGREEAIAIFSRIFLDEADLLPLYRQLAGLSQHKPWDCVGTIDECQAALFLLSRNDAWRNTLAVRTLMPELEGRKGAGDLEAQVTDALTPRNRGALPEAFHEAALRLA